MKEQTPKEILARTLFAVTFASVAATSFVDQPRQSSPEITPEPTTEVTPEVTPELAPIISPNFEATTPIFVRAFHATPEQRDPKGLDKLKIITVNGKGMLGGKEMQILPMKLTDISINQLQINGQDMSFAFFDFAFKVPGGQATVRFQVNEAVANGNIGVFVSDISEHPEYYPVGNRYNIVIVAPPTSISGLDNQKVSFCSSLPSEAMLTPNQCLFYIDTFGKQATSAATFKQKLVSAKPNSLIDAAKLGIHLEYADNLGK